VGLFRLRFARCPSLELKHWRDFNIVIDSCSSGN
jgi:hypothetical protein